MWRSYPAIKGSWWLYSWSFLCLKLGFPSSVNLESHQGGGGGLDLKMATVNKDHFTFPVCGLYWQVWLYIKSHTLFGQIQKGKKTCWLTCNDVYEPHIAIWIKIVRQKSDRSIYYTIIVYGDTSDCAYSVYFTCNVIMRRKCTRISLKTCVRGVCGPVV
jgi:hypothetical protein